MLWLIATITATLTAFYMFRLLFLTFFGELRADHDVAHHVHESPAVMTIPLVILAVLSIVGGWVGLPEHWLWGNRSASSWRRSPATRTSSTAAMLGEGALMLIATALAVAGATLAYVFYVRLPGLPMVLSWRLRGVYELLLDKYRVDELYDAIIVRPYVRVSTFLWRVVDQELIDGFVNGLAGAVGRQRQPLAPGPDRQRAALRARVPRRRRRDARLLRDAMTRLEPAMTRATCC